MKSLYKNLARDGIKRYKRLYYPFIGTTVFFIVLINMCISIIFDETLNTQYGMMQMSFIISLGVFILVLFSTISLGNNYKFIQKGKAGENGLYLILGMEKKHLNKIYGYELGFIYLISALIGTLISLLLYKFASAFLVRLLGDNLNVLESGIFPSLKPFGITALIFLGVFILLYILQIFRSRKYSPITYITESKAGDKPPKYPVLNGSLGIILIAAGYYLSLTVTDSYNAIKRFWVAVILVIIGTSLAFSVIVSKVLKLLQKNKNYYYKKDNFTAISGLLYRVQKSSNTLANIAIFSTMVIIVLTSGFSLYFGADEYLDKVYPSEYKIQSLELKDNKDDIIANVKSTLESENKDYTLNYYFSEFAPTEIVDRNAVNVEINDDFSNLLSKDLFAIYLDEESTADFNGYDALVIDNEISPIDDIGNMGLKIGAIKNYPNKFAYEQLAISDYNRIVIKDKETFDKITNYLLPNDKDETLFLLLDTDYDEDLAYKIRTNINNAYPDSHFIVRSSKVDRLDFKTMYSGIFFVGIILGLGFLVSTALAIYYKQLSEGLEDASRFKTMRQLGMTDKEAKKSINKQMGLVFFLPLIFAFSHSLFAMPIVINFLGILGLNNARLFIKVLLVVFLAYIVFYLVTYKMTSKTYNKIVLE